MAWASSGQRITLALLVSCSMAGAAACGLARGGLGADLGTTGSDAASDDASDEDSLPSSCTTLDAACLGALPSGWQPVSVTDAGCGPSFDAATLLVHPRVEDGGCACGACQIVGSFACSAAVDISGGNSCGDPTLVTAPDGVCTPAQAQHVEAHLVDASGSVGCFVPNDAGSGAAADTLTVCFPGCAADFCGSSSRCVVSEGEPACPPGFTLFAHAGTGADPGCAPCGCQVGPPGTCGGTVTVFDNDTCTDSGAMATYPVGACNQFSTTSDYQSVLVHLAAPDASCVPSPPSAGATGDASLLGTRTICCQ